MNSIRKTLAVALAILFILTAVVAQYAYTVERRAFAPEAYQQALAKDKFYERVPAILAASVADTVPKRLLPVGLRGMSSENWVRFIGDLLPPETLKEMGDQGMASIFGFLNGESDTAQISMKPLKERMAGEVGTQAVINLMRTQPVCTLAEMATIAEALVSEREVTLCNPPENLYPVIMPLVSGQLQLASAALPEEVTLAIAAPDPGQADPRQRLQLVRWGMRLSPILPLLLLLVLTVVAVRSLRDWLDWWGVSFLLTGLISAASAWLGAPVAGFMLLRVVTPMLPRIFPEALLQNSSQLAAAIVEQMLSPILMQGIVLALVGAVMLAATLIARRMEIVEGA